MLRQYNPSRFRLHNGRRVGSITVGDIIYIQDGVRPFSFPEQPICRDPWQVIAWIPREAPGTDRKTGRLVMKRCAGGHLALVRSLRTNRVQRVADWILHACVDAGLDRH